MSENEVKKPIINCHAHVFKGEHVPPFLAKTVVWWPFYYLLNVPLFIRIYRVFVRLEQQEHRTSEKIKARKWKLIKLKIARSLVLKIIKSILKLVLVLHALAIVFTWWGFGHEWIDEKAGIVFSWLADHFIIFIPEQWYLQLIILLVVVTFVRTVRKVLRLVSNQFRKWISLIPGSMSRSLIQRYMKLARYTLYGGQKEIFRRLAPQYPKGTKFILLPMDMEYMGAGKLKSGGRYANQMEELNDLYQTPKLGSLCLPFIFADPRRIKEDQNQLKYSVENGKVRLKDCFIKTYLEDRNFRGVKIYPALGYYPFDEALLPLWKYCADNQIPILTHCIKGTIFYRGKKKKEWDFHPVFKEVAHDKKPSHDYILLDEKKNKRFTLNFTNPMNYLVLLEEELLRKWVANCSSEIKELFGFTGIENPLKYDLSHLKICFGHFGGNDQWLNYLDKDRDYDGMALNLHPERGINLCHTADGHFSWFKVERNWKHSDWYSLICSMMLQFPNVYADISYILHDEEIFPLLKQTIHHKGLSEKVLFGTDFYVVRNHSSEKNLLVETQAALETEEFDQIARINPEKYISSRFFPLHQVDTIDEIEPV